MFFRRKKLDNRIVGLIEIITACIFSFFFRIAHTCIIPESGHL